jgi:Hfq protein
MRRLDARDKAAVDWRSPPVAAISDEARGHIMRYRPGEIDCQGCLGLGCSEPSSTFSVGPQMPQDQFLNALAEGRVPVTIYLVNGIRRLRNRSMHESSAHEGDRQPRVIGGINAKAQGA